MSYIPAKNAYSRVFLIERRARGDRAPVYHSSLIAGAVEQSFGDIEKIEVPDPDKYGEFQEIGNIRGGEERATTSLSGRYAADLASELLRLAKIKLVLARTQLTSTTSARPSFSRMSSLPRSRPTS